MPLSEKEKLELSKYRLRKAKDLLKDAKNLLELEGFDSSVNRSYYAILTAARSLLILRGIDAETHDGVRTMFSREFIKTGILPEEFSDVFRTLQARRIDSDYGDYVDVGKDKAIESFNRAAEFVEKVEEILKEMLKDSASA